jgi:hypothetical protein
VTCDRRGGEVVATAAVREAFDRRLLWHVEDLVDSMMARAIGRRGKHVGQGKGNARLSIALLNLAIGPAEARIWHEPTGAPAAESLNDAELAAEVARRARVRGDPTLSEAGKRPLELTIAHSEAPITRSKARQVA